MRFKLVDFGGFKCNTNQMILLQPDFVTAERHTGISPVRADVSDTGVEADRLPMTPCTPGGEGNYTPHQIFFFTKSATETVSLSRTIFFHRKSA